MPTLKTGEPAPSFSLLDNNQKKHSLTDYQGQWLIIFFYPKDNTPGCTVEVCQFRNDFEDIAALDTIILGINTDNSASHQNFINQQQLPFSLLSDQTGEVSKSYGSLFKFGPLKFCKRHSFIIDQQGKLAKIYRKVTPSNHSKEVISDLQELQRR